MNGTAFVGSSFPRGVVVETAGHRALSSRGQGVPRAPLLHFELKLRGGAQLPTGSLQGRGQKLTVWNHVGTAHLRG